MKIRFVGASNGTVTGSCTQFFYQRTGTQFLVDCGMYQGEWNAEEKNLEKFIFNPEEIKFVILTHAHLDHCGLIPKLYKYGFYGDVICTTATAEIAKIIFKDICKNSSDLYEEEYINRVNFRCIDKREDFGFSKFMAIGNDIKISLMRSSHILGAVSVNIAWVNRDGRWENIVMSGDIGGSNKEKGYSSLLHHTMTPYGNPRYMVVESTYGKIVRDSKYSCFESRIDCLKGIIKENYTKKNIMIIPAFSLQRTQEILFDIFNILGMENGYEFNRSEMNFKKVLRIIKFLDGNGLPPFAYKELLGLNLIPEESRRRWKDAFIEKKIDESTKWYLVNNRDVTYDEIRESLISLRPIHVILDSPMARNISSIFGKELCRRQHRNPEEKLYRNKLISKRLHVTELDVDNIVRKIFPISSKIDEDLYCGRHKIQYAKKFSLPKNENSRNEFIILVTGSGMCEGGPILSHIGDALQREDVIILTTGFMANNSLGNELKKIARYQAENTNYCNSVIKIKNKNLETRKIKSKIYDFGAYYSGHADSDQLVEFASIENPLISGNTEEKRTIFINHGDEEARNYLKSKLVSISPVGKQKNINLQIELPTNGNEWFDLDCNEWITESDSVVSCAEILKKILNEQRKTNILIEKLIKKIN